MKIQNNKLMYGGNVYSFYRTKTGDNCLILGLGSILCFCQCSFSLDVNCLCFRLCSYLRISVEVASDSAAIAFHRASEHLVIASTNKENLLLSLCTTDGKPKRTYKLKETGIVSNITVTAKGRIVVALTQQLKDEYQGKVIVL